MWCGCLKPSPVCSPLTSNRPSLGSASAYVGVSVNRSKLSEPHVSVAFRVAKRNTCVPPQYRLISSLCSLSASGKELDIYRMTSGLLKQVDYSFLVKLYHCPSPAIFGLWFTVGCCSAVHLLEVRECDNLLSNTMGCCFFF